MFSLLRRREVAQLNQEIEMLKARHAITLSQISALMVVLAAALIQMSKSQRDTVIEAIKTDVAKGLTETGAPNSIEEKYKQVYMDGKSAMLQNFIEVIGPS